MSVRAAAAAAALGRRTPRGYTHGSGTTTCRPSLPTLAPRDCGRCLSSTGAAVGRDDYCRRQRLSAPPSLLRGAALASSWCSPVVPSAACVQLRRSLSNRSGGGGDGGGRRRRGGGTAPASAGRIVMHGKQRGGEKKSKAAPRLCGGCGVEIVRGGGGGGRGGGGDTTTAGMAAGHDAAESSRSTQKRKAAYADVLDAGKSGFLCDRCKSLRQGRDGVWGAYDALRDVNPAVFKKQLQYIVKRRKFGLCIKVVDAADLEGSIVRGIRDSVGSVPLILAVNKVDLLPRPVTGGDLRYMKRRVDRRGVRCISAHAVSARTGEGVADLAERVLADLGGRDVFVVGAANVGKSSLVKRLTELIAESIKFKGSRGKKRRGAVTELEPTVSHLPGTTLQAIRIPCFPSHRHALWDTPGIINDASLSYHVFPPHLMEPLARPDPIEVRPPVYVRPGQSVLMEASWMAGGGGGGGGGGGDGDALGENADSDDDDGWWGDDDDEVESSAPVLARLDVTESEYGAVEVRPFVPPCIGVRVVPTSDAPDEAVIPESVLDRVRERTRTKMQDSDEDKAYAKKKLESFAELRPSEDTRGNYTADVAFSSLGWLSVYSVSPYALDPKCVQGSRFFKREPRMYPPNIEQQQQQEQQLERREGAEDQEEVRRRLASAAREGKHLANRRRGEKQNRRDDDEWADGGEDWGDVHYW